MASERGSAGTAEGGAGDDAVAPVPRGRLIAYYAALVVVVVAVTATVFTLGSDEEPRTPIAGGYDTVNPCLG